MRILITAATVTFSSLGLPNHAHACVTFDQADPVFWTEHASIIVDATLTGLEQRPFAKGGIDDTLQRYPDPWVLKLNVHRTLRGDELERREVVTRFLNTTVADEAFFADLVGRRKEFAIVNVPYTDFSDLFQGSHSSDFPGQNGIHVLNENGERIDEIWELLCQALPVFEVGTFKD